jgi:hypothetical protein
MRVIQYPRDVSDEIERLRRTGYPHARIGVKIVGSLFDIDVFFLAVRGDAGEAQSWIVAGDRLWAAE